MRKKKREPYVFKPSTHELFFCLSSMPRWSKILLDNSTRTSYLPFLKLLIEKKFFVYERENSSQRMTIKNLAVWVNQKPSEVTKWIAQIYDDMIELNLEQEKLFKTEGIKHNLFFKYLYDNTAVVSIWLKYSPKQFESIYFPFVKGKVGTDHFWVKEIIHHITDTEHYVDLMLNGRILNRYREFLYEKAIFERKISWYESHNMEEFEIDKRLMEEYH